jgi:NADPH2:quinone reductase
MAEQALVGEGAWFPVPGGVDDVTAAALLNGMAAGEDVSLSALALRRAPVQVSGSGTGSGTGRPATPADFAAAYAGLLKQAAAGEISLDIAAVPLADVEKAWRQPAAGQRVVFVP